MKRTALCCLAVATFLSAAALSGAALAGDESAAEKFRKMDTNGDGRMSSAEHDTAMRMMFTKMDTNRDGSVTAAEMEAGHKMMMKEAGMMKSGMKGGMKDAMHTDAAHPSPPQSGDMNMTEPMPATTDDGND